MNSKDQWIKEIENSLSGLNLVEPNPYLFSKIMNKLEQRTVSVLSKKWLWLSLSAVLVLALLNLLIMLYLTNSFKPINSDLQDLSNHYKLFSTSTLNYN